MTSIKRFKTLYDASAAANGDWFRLDTRYDESPSRIINVDLVSGDTITLQGTTKDVRGSDPATVTAGIETDEIATIETFTADSTEHELRGPWTYIRIVKTGTTGNAKVTGFI